MEWNIRVYGKYEELLPPACGCQLSKVNYYTGDVEYILLWGLFL